jgi:hypothetical protein
MSITSNLLFRKKEICYSKIISKQPQVSKRHEFPQVQADLEGLELTGKNSKNKHIYAVFDKVYDHKAFANSINLYSKTFDKRDREESESDSTIRTANGETETQTQT